MGKVQKTHRGLVRNISEDLLKISPNDIMIAIQEEIDDARADVKSIETPAKAGLGCVLEF